MNVFFDTTDFFSDPYFRSNPRKLLLDLARAKAVTLFLSEVVLLEMENHIRSNIPESFREAEKSVRKVQQLVSDLTFVLPPMPDPEIARQAFRDFIETLEVNETLRIVRIDNEIYPEVLRRSIQGIKPFTLRKQEFRDALIWLSYADYARKYQLKNSAFISNNIEDFYGKDKTGLHPDLALDWKVNLFKNSWDLFHRHPDLIPFKQNPQLIDLISDTSQEILVEILTQEYHEPISSFIFDIIQRLPPHRFDPELYDGLVRGEPPVSIVAVSSMQKEVIEDQLYVTAVIVLHTAASVFEDIAFRKDPGEDSFVLRDEITLEYEMEVSIFLDADYQWSDFEIHGAYLL